MEILARRQPTASDLRLVVAVIKVTNDLERIGDEAKRIARTALSMTLTPTKGQQLAPIADFAVGVGKLLHDTLDAFARIDVDVAMQVKQRDRLLDAQYGDIMRQQISNMSEDPRSIPNALNLIWAARALERIGDRSCNICEYTVYYAIGKNISHMSLEEAKIDLLGH
jgi:phosphate transport system protein